MHRSKRLAIFLPIKRTCTFFLVFCLQLDSITTDFLPPRYWTGVWGWDTRTIEPWCLRLKSVAMINTTTSVTSSLLLWSSCTSLQLQSSSFFIGAAGHDGIVGHFRVGAIWEPLFKPCTAYVTPWSAVHWCTVQRDSAQCTVHSPWD